MLEMEIGFLGVIGGWLDYGRESNEMYQKKVDEVQKGDLMG